MAALELDDMSLELLGLNKPSEDVPDEEETQTTTTREKDRANTQLEDTDLVEPPKEEEIEEKQPEKEEPEEQDSTNVINEFAKLLKEKGVLESIEIDDINDEDKLTEAIRKVIDNGISDRQKSIEKALKGGMEPTDIQRYETTLYQLDSIKEDALEEETEDADKLRQYLIYNDLISRGYSDEKAQKQLKRIFDAGDDIDEAKDSLNNLRKYYSDRYKAEVKAAKDANDAMEKKLSEESENLHQSILKNEMLGGIETDERTRNKIWDAVSKPSIKDADGRYYTELQNYEKNNRADFLRHVGFFYVMTDGFKNMDKLIKTKVNKEYNKKVSKFEDMLRRGQKTTSEGNLQYMTETSGNMTLENLKKLVEGNNRK